MRMNSSGNFGINCADPDHLLELGGTGTGCNTGTGSYIAAGSTAFTANSSQEWKQNIQTYDIPDILAKIQATPARTFDWKPQYCTGPDCINNLGFIAQEFYGVLGRGDGLHVNGQDIMMAEWLGIQHLNLNLDAVTGTVAPLPGSDSESFATAFFTSVENKIGTWLADAANGIGDFFANRVHTKELCVKDSSGETCITKTQLDAMLAGNSGNVVNNTGGNGGSGGGQSGGGGSSQDTTAPVIMLTGDATINLNIGDSYSELGGTVTDDVDSSVAVIVSGSVDTETAGTYTIHYNASDTAGNHATEVTRTVNVN
jgi:hypothetical protein